MKINLFMQDGINTIMKNAGRFYLNNKRGRTFISKITPQMKQNAALRDANEKNGIHIPPFLIASIASECNLHCSGCYARAGGSCSESDNKDLSAEEWREVFKEASKLGV